MPTNSIRLSSSTTVSRYKELVKNNDKAALASFLIERFEERYFLPVMSSESKHGFTIMAISCLVIETLEAFYQGRNNTHGLSKKMFSDFFERCTDFSEFLDGADWFYKDIRCGILHQAETRNGWKIIRSGPLLDRKDKKINASLFLEKLQKAVLKYSEEIQTNKYVWEMFCKKLDAICKNCE